jgi:dextranase
MSQSSMKGAAVILTAAALFMYAAGCRQAPDIRVEQVEYGKRIKEVFTDKAAYSPGQPVRFNVRMQEEKDRGKLFIRYRQLDEVVKEETREIKGGRLTWEWLPPDTDGKGYMAELFFMDGSKAVDHMNIAVDVSSDWGRFPRYGYLADFPKMDMDQMAAVIERLNRYHLNGIQFYDWQYKHHMPVKWEAGKPAAEWQDIADRPVSFDTVKGYIELVHGKSMKAMNYNLLFGAYADAERDGVKKEWALYKDPRHEEQDLHDLPDSWASDIYLYDPSNPKWQDYLLNAEKNTFDVLPFDGWHVDQLGSRGSLWTYEGKPVDLAGAFPGFLQKARDKLRVDLVMNAVGQYGQPGIAAKAPVKFLYTEAWQGQSKYRNLKDIIDLNWRNSEGKLSTVLAAYVNYKLADSPGEFNAPGVLLADAVIFAAGGSHLELGENMLAKEYFPNKNLRVPAELEEQLIHYYDFLVAYQNLLRDQPVELELEITGSDIPVSPSAEQGEIFAFAKSKDGRDILHLINFTESVTQDWNDSMGRQPEPAVRENTAFTVKADRPVAGVWVASPDFYGGSPVSLAFVQKDGTLDFTVPMLKYWDMVVIEYR